MTCGHTEKLTGFSDYLDRLLSMWSYVSTQEGIIIFGKWLGHCKCQAINTSKVKAYESEEKVSVR